MKPSEMLEILTVAERLKCNTRHCHTSTGRHESVAEHSWRVSLMAMLLKPEFPEADMDKVIRMCLLHDLGEAFTGDIPSFLKTGEDESKEDALLADWVSSLPPQFSAEMSALYREIEERETLESRIFKAIDGMEAVMQHNASDLATWLPLEYQLNLTYAEDKVAFSPYLTQLRRAIREETEQKLKEGGKL